MQVNLLFGFLGSGKTTLVKHILAERGRQVKTAVIVNEFGEVGVDGEILRGSNVDMVELNSGCLCCTLRGSLMLAVEELRAKAKVDRIIVEATGIAQPGELVDTLADSSLKLQFDVGPLVTVVDTAKFRKLNAMLGEFYAAQIENADILVLNKIDLVSPQELEQVRHEVRDINPTASLVFAEQCDVDTDLLLGNESSLPAEQGAVAITPLRSFGGRSVHDEHGQSDHHHGEGDQRHLHGTPVESFVLPARSDAERGEVERFFIGLAPNVWRAKGFMRIDGATSLVQYAAGQLEIAGAPRRTDHQIVFIGHDMNRPDIESGFAALARQ